MNYIIIVFIFFPWFAILSKFNILERILLILDSLFKDETGESTSEEKKWIILLNKLLNNLN